MINFEEEKFGDSPEKISSVIVSIMRDRELREVLLKMICSDAKATLRSIPLFHLDFVPTSISVPWEKIKYGILLIFFISQPT